MSPETTFQTARLRRGRHRSAEDGACVMELASMIAGEPFSDHPQCVSPVIGALLRAYNDLSGDDRRQDLLRFASDAVGSRGSDVVETARLQHCLDVLTELEEARSHSLLWRLRSPAPTHLRAWLDGYGATSRIAEEFLGGMARVLRGGGSAGHVRFVELVDELIALRDPEAAPPRRLHAGAVEI